MPFEKGSSRPGRRFFENISWLSVGHGLSMAIGLLTTAYLARTLGEHAFGLYSYAQTISIYAALVIDWGWNVYGNREVAKDQKKAGQILKNICVFQSLSGVLLLALVGGFSATLNIWYMDLKLIVLASLLWVFPYSLNVEWLFLGFQKMRIVALGRLVQNIFALFLSVLLVSNPQKIILAPIARTLGGMISAGWLLSKIPKGILAGTSLSLREATGYFKGSIWFWLSALLVQAFHGTDVLILNLYWPPREIGYYSAAFRILNIGTAIISLVNVTMFPMLAAEYYRKRADFNNLLKYNIIISGLVVATVVVLITPAAGWIMTMVYGQQYKGGAAILKILFYAAAVLTVNGAIAQPLLAAGYEKFVFIQILLTAILNVTSNFYFIPRFGGFGAAWVYLASVAFGTAMLFPMYIVMINRFRGLRGSKSD